MLDVQCILSWNLPELVTSLCTMLCPPKLLRMNGFVRSGCNMVWFWTALGHEPAGAQSLQWFNPVSFRPWPVAPLEHCMIDSSPWDAIQTLWPAWREGMERRAVAGWSSKQRHLARGVSGSSCVAVMCAEVADCSFWLLTWRTSQVLSATIWLQVAHLEKLVTHTQI